MARPPSQPAPDPRLASDDAVRAWARSLDDIDYLTLLDLPTREAPSDEQVRDAWRAFALAFHPDRHRDAPEDVRAASTRVFQRGAEAYRVLQDPTLRRTYLELLIGDGALRLSPSQFERAKAEGGARSARDLVSSPAARAFAEKADELLGAGKLEAARLQLQLARTREPGNDRLARLLTEIERRIVAARPAR
jgi:curved DNA-binding protein CbpA